MFIAPPLLVIATSPPLISPFVVIPFSPEFWIYTTSLAEILPLAIISPFLFGEVALFRSTPSKI